MTRVLPCKRLHMFGRNTYCYDIIYLTWQTHRHKYQLVLRKLSSIIIISLLHHITYWLSNRNSHRRQFIKQEAVKPVEILLKERLPTMIPLTFFDNRIPSETHHIDNKIPSETHHRMFHGLL